MKLRWVFASDNVLFGQLFDVKCSHTFSPQWEENLWSYGCHDPVTRANYEGTKVDLFPAC